VLQLLDEELLYLAVKYNLPVYFLSVFTVRFTYWLVEGDFLFVESSILSLVLLEDFQLFVHSHEFIVLLVEPHAQFLKLIEEESQL
jgi:hypothetical protein